MVVSRLSPLLTEDYNSYRVYDLRSPRPPAASSLDGGSPFKNSSECCVRGTSREEGEEGNRRGGER